MALNISSLASLTTSINSLSDLIIVSPQPSMSYYPLSNRTDLEIFLQPNPALLFHYEGENTLALESDITDHFSEDNTSLQDQIALRPETVTVHGFIGELNDIPPNAKLQELKEVADRLPLLAAYVPELSITALNAYNEAIFLYSTAQKALLAAQIAASTTGGSEITGSPPSQNKQQTMFQAFHKYWTSRTLFNVQTPWVMMPNMAIKSLRAIQDSDTRMITDFEVTFKKMRFASTTVKKIPQGRRTSQSSGVTNNGAQALSSPAPLSLTSGLSNITAVA